MKGECVKLEIFEPQNEIYSQKISWNYEELKKELTANLEKYKDVAYSDKQLSVAKKDRAGLNNFRKAIERQRIGIKKKYLENYLSFEGEVKDILNILDPVIESINAQVVRFESVKKEKKKEAIKNYYNEIIGDLFDLLPFERIFKDAWLNLSCSISKAEGEIFNLTVKVKADLQILEELDTNFTKQLMSFYAKNLDLSATLQEQKKLEAEQEKVEVYQLKQKEQKKAITAPAPAPASEPASEPAPEPKASEPKASEPIKEDRQSVKPVDFRAWLTIAQAIKLKEFLKENNIKIERLNNDNK